MRIIYCVADISNLKKTTVYQAYQVQFGERSSPIDAILPLLPGVPLMITKNVDRPLSKHSSSLPSVLLTYIDLVIGKIVYFCGFADAQGKRQDGYIISPPAYMLVSVPGSEIQLRDLPVGVIPMPPFTFTFKVGVKGSATFRQFPTTLAYAITDCKCQADTYDDGLLSDLRKPLTGSTEVASLYVQLSRVPSLRQLSIMRSFDQRELRKPLPMELLKELEWEVQMDEETKNK